MDPTADIPPFLITDRIALLSRVHVSTTLVLFVLCLIPFLARIYVRVWPVWRFGLDDGFIVAGLLCAIADWILLEREMFYQTGTVPWEEVSCAVILAYFAIPIWCLAMTLIKTSVVLTLLRLPLKRAWKAALYVILAAQLLFGLSNFLYNFVKCEPHNAAWDFTIYPRKCPSDHTDIIVSHLGSTMNITTDLLLSIAPMCIFWNLRRPLRERILICSLTGIGLFATFASIMKVVIITKWTDLDDRWATAVSIATWTITEQLAGIMAACSPSLKKPIERVLNKVGIPLVENDQVISFVHVPADMRDGEQRRQARSWLGEGRSQISLGQPGSRQSTPRDKDNESLESKSPMFASGFASNTTV